ncbi:hypothetical protein [Candidatus Nanopusillus massiliensis]|uniref:hypothetical protein n=1 Tax=Candidatus Nanopusillus massiliensis TaxID=2897163 RepID=UPI001E4A9661|nr:hypothetical protein [Candidatus Nanopusillus massiliensis]
MEIYEIISCNLLSISMLNRLNIMNEKIIIYDIVNKKGFIFDKKLFINSNSEEIKDIIDK